MPDSMPNPYAVTTALVETGEQEAHVLTPNEVIQLSGSVSKQELDLFLQTHEHVGVSDLVRLTLVLSPIAAIFLLFGGVSFLLPLAGVLGGMLIAITTSSKGYRRSLFMETYPNWDQGFSAKLSESGMVLQKNGVQISSSWKLASAITESDQIIAIEWSLPREAITILSPTMTQRLEDWAKIRSHLRTLIDPKKPEEKRSKSEYLAGRLVGDRNRQRSVAIPETAIRLEGLTHAINVDLREPNRSGRRRLTTRAKWIRISLTACIAMCVIGVAAILPLNGLLRSILAIAGIGYFTRDLWGHVWRSDNSNQGTPNRWTLGFASEDGVFVDLRDHSVWYPWNALTQSEPIVDTAVLHFGVGNDSEQPKSTLRLDRELCESDADWQKLQSLWRQ